MHSSDPSADVERRSLDRSWLPPQRSLQETQTSSTTGKIPHIQGTYEEQNEEFKRHTRPLQYIIMFLKIFGTVYGDGC